MITIRQHLWFARDMRAALENYVALIPNSRIEWITPLDAETPSGPAGSVIRANFTLGGQAYAAIQAGEHHPFNDSFSIMVTVATQAELDHIWETLLQGGNAQACGWLIDRWGLRWQVIPARLGELMADPDPARAERVMKQMLSMVKLDIAPLQAAADAG